MKNYTWQQLQVQQQHKTFEIHECITDFTYLDLGLFDFLPKQHDVT
jgi:hypothetical protein